MRIFAIALLTFVNLLTFAQKPVVYLIEIKGEINASSSKKLSKGILKAKEIGADALLLHLNTYGGAVDAADSMRSALLALKIPTAVYIDNQAVSAGALISIACDSIYMKKGGTIGAATVVDQTGSPMPDKYQSFMRAMMRSTAEGKGRDPQIAEAMVNPSINIEGVVDSTRVLSLTSSEAMKLGYCEGIASNLDEALSLFMGELGYIVEKQHLSLLDRVLLFFLSPIIQGLLLMAIIGGIYFELQTPGLGLPSIVAILAAIFYFSPLYIEGLAQYWEIIIFVIGVLLILAEIFIIPGFGVAGISGIVLTLTGLSFAMIDNSLFYFEGSFNFLVIIKPLSIVMLSAFISLVGSIFLAGHLLTDNRLPKISLHTSLKGDEGFVSSDMQQLSFIGRRAIVKTAMRPTGKIELEGRWYEATMNVGMAEPGDNVEIIKYEGGRFYCEHPHQ